MSELPAWAAALAPRLLELAPAALAGAALGGVFFVSLWWTARRGAASSWPALWFFASLLLRMALVLSGFYVVGAGDWRRMLTCLAGFVIARTMLTRRILSSRPGRFAGREEARDAP
jgi:F1F0 ATPase subunit 2